MIVADLLPHLHMVSNSGAVSATVLFLISNIRKIAKYYQKDKYGSKSFPKLLCNNDFI